jgi:Kelch motif
MGNGKVLVAGGQRVGDRTDEIKSAEIYDPSTSIFGLTGNMTTMRVFHTAILLKNGTVLIAGGHKWIRAPHGGVVETVLLATAEIYDPTSGTFIPTGDMVAGRYRHTATLLMNGEVLIAGGQTMTGSSDSAELYDPNTGKFHPAGRLGVARFSPTATLLTLH